MTATQPVKVEVAPDHSKAWTHFEHMGYDDFGRAETLEHYKIAKLMEAGRFFGFAKGGVLDFSKIINYQYGMFLIGMHYKFNPHLWNIRRGVAFPIKMSLEVTDVGKTSATVFSQLVNKLDDQELAQCSCKHVYIDRATRRPVNLPEASRSKFSAYVREKKPLELPRTSPEVPPAAYMYKVRVAPSDTDINGHTNHSSYIRYCTDAAQMALKDGRVVRYEKDLARYPLLEMDVVYTGESDAGDELNVFLWQKDLSPDCFTFVIHRPEKDSGKDTAIFHSSMTFGLERSPVAARL